MRMTSSVRAIGCVLSLTIVVGVSASAEPRAAAMTAPPVLSPEWVSYRSYGSDTGRAALVVDGERLLFSYTNEKPSRVQLKVESASRGEQLPSGGLAGESIWSMTRDDGNISRILGMALHNSGAVVALRVERGSLSTQLPPSARSGVELIGYSASTGIEGWSRLVGVSARTCGAAVASSGSHLLLTAAFSGIVDFGQGQVTSSLDPDNCDMFLASYDISSGALEWVVPTARIHSTPSSISADEGGITVVGYGVNPDGYPAKNFVEHYNTTGQSIWNATLGTSGQPGTSEKSGVYGSNVTTPTSVIFMIATTETFSFGGWTVPYGSSLVALDRSSGGLLWIRKVGVGPNANPLAYGLLKATMDGTLIVATTLDNGIGFEPNGIAGLSIGGVPAVAEFANFGSGPILWSRLLPTQTAGATYQYGNNQIDDVEVVGDYLYMTGSTPYPFGQLPVTVRLGFQLPGERSNFVGKLNRTQSDQTPPSISTQLLPQPNGSGWNNTAVSIVWASVDPAPSSGAPTQLAATTVSSEGASQVITSAPSCDPAGNCGTGSVTVSIDQTPPLITGVAVASPNANGWYRAPVTVHFTCTDALSGVASCSTDVILTTSSVNQSATGTVTDRAGNIASATVTGIKIDTVAPTAAVMGVSSGATYNLGAVPTVACNTVDQPGGSGVATFASLSTTRTAAGVFTTTCTGGTDNAGNTAIPGAATYTVTVGTGGGAAGLKALVSSYVAGSGVSSANGIISSLNAQIDNGNWCEFIKKVNDAFAKGTLTISQLDELLFWATTRTTTC
jgi:hypothetical protein